MRGVTGGRGREVTEEIGEGGREGEEDSDMAEAEEAMVVTIATSRVAVEVVDMVSRLEEEDMEEEGGEVRQEGGMCVCTVNPLSLFNPNQDTPLIRTTFSPKHIQIRDVLLIFHISTTSGRQNYRVSSGQRK